ncbi:MAG: carboxypeptidase-like regulatory domain-containing protein, partial [Gemmatimonadaceae bacterium]|nr:carboxypeptidase-like regulatory domain-containing protein [Chitinophagaceae bacterium]
MHIPQWIRRNKFAFLLLVLTLSAAGAMAQVTISGKVTGKESAALPGISVQLQGTNSGTATDAAGNFSLTAVLKQGTYNLVFTGIGFKTQESSVTIGSALTYTVNISLTEDALGLDEVVVTGTSQGTTRRQLGNYISTIKADELGKTGNVLSALQGKTAGAQVIQNSGDPAGGISVRLRGISSISSSSEPLYIVDGVIVNNATNRVTNTSGNYDGNNFVGTIGQNRLVD